MSNFVPRSQFA